MTDARKCEKLECITCKHKEYRPAKNKNTIFEGLSADICKLTGKLIYWFDGPMSFCPLIEEVK